MPDHRKLFVVPSDTRQVTCTCCNGSEFVQIMSSPMQRAGAIVGYSLVLRCLPCLVRGVVSDADGFLNVEVVR